MSESKHTPMPLNYDRRTGVIMDHEGAHLYGPCTTADIQLAPMIVRAVNCHDELLAACKELMEEVKHAISQAGYDPDDRDSILQARAAIAKAKGRK